MHTNRFIHRPASPSRPQLRLAIALMLTGIMAGCGGVDRPETVPVSGVVTYNGQPLAGAYVLFIPQQGRQASATTKDDGSFELMTFEPGDGAVPGTYTAAVEKRAPAREEDPYATRKSEIPERYNSVQRSGLTYTVKDDGENRFNIDLKD